ncbi:MAG: TonB C-terminal domain-containing protein, partial [Desulfovibrionaceae bacterium]|nr:TonB C-terminal domain-containing protein [Desulfovibrionaceae bacterium]
EEAETDDPPPMDDNLGIDAEGEAGSDSFGLLGKKGGAPVIGSGGRSLMTQYAWYNQIVEREIRRNVDNLLKREGFPSGSIKAQASLFLDDNGGIVRYAVHESSGNAKIDEILLKALAMTSISQRPPEGMPRGMRIVISTRG